MAKTIAELEAQLATLTNPVARKTLEQQITKRKLVEQAGGGSDIANALVMLQQVIDAAGGQGMGGGAGISQADVQKAVQSALSNMQIGIDQLDPKIQQYLLGSSKVQLELKTPSGGISAAGQVTQQEYERPLFQKLLCDLIAMNNVYLFGAAGTGKTFIAEMIARFMDYDFVLLSCNQFTSQLDILGGQTVEGYQYGKLEMAWGNMNANGEPNGKKGSVLCLDELPKIDPNTAGILNEALAKVKNYRGGEPPVILNGRNQKIKKGNLFIIATGNTKLNETSTDYEANFKQDLSLQDRFVGSTYEIMPDYEQEFNTVLKDMAFLFIALIRLRRKIDEMKYQSFAFVSYRIMINLAETYKTFRGIVAENQAGVGGPLVSTINKPKTLKQGMDSFLNLFKPDQMEILKEAMEYDKFVALIEVKNSLPMDQLNTPEEMKIVADMIKENKEELAKKIA